MDVVHYIGGHPRTLEFLDAILRDGRFTYSDVQRRLLKKLPEDALGRLNRSEGRVENKEGLWGTFLTY